MFTKKDSTIYKNWLMDKPICEIAKYVRTNESHVRETVAKIDSQVASFEDSVRLMEELGIVKKISPPKEL